MRYAAILAIGLGLSTSLAQAEPVTLAEENLGEITAGLVDFPDINVGVGIGTTTIVQSGVVAPTAVAPFGQATAGGVVGSGAFGSNLIGVLVGGS